LKDLGEKRQVPQEKGILPSDPNCNLDSSCLSSLLASPADFKFSSSLKETSLSLAPNTLHSAVKSRVEMQGIQSECVLQRRHEK
jgi:hypothetical protein